MHRIRTKFRHTAQNDSNGKITRQALQHLIATIFGTQRQIRTNQIDKLLERINLKYSNKIRFNQFSFVLLIFFYIKIVLMNLFKHYLMLKKNFLNGCHHKKNLHHQKEQLHKCFLF
jgi:hypothetical protein